MSIVIQSNTHTATRACPRSVNPTQWHQSLGYARQACARVFRDGGNPADAVAAFGVMPGDRIDWSRAVEMIADVLCTRSARRVA